MKNDTNLFFFFIYMYIKHNNILNIYVYILLQNTWINS